VEEIDVAIIGAGVTGLACGHHIAARGYSVCVLERHARPGNETSTHNSGVIHAGMYYPTGTLKTRLCVEGRPLLYEFCRDRGIVHSRCGKLVVAASESEVAQLETLHARGVANGVEGLEIVDRAFIARREPAVNAVAALYSPMTASSRPRDVRALLQSAQAAGVIFLPALPCWRRADGCSILVRTEHETSRRGRSNAAGLYADDVSRMAGGESFDLSLSWRIRRAGCVEALFDQRPHLPAAPRDGTWAGRASDDVHSGQRDWTHGAVPKRKDDYEDDRLPLEAFVEPTRALLPAYAGGPSFVGQRHSPEAHPPEESFRIS
jgi:glycine/D-amino acid oxidase-like deaminating enzyme